MKAIYFLLTIIISTTALISCNDDDEKKIKPEGMNKDVLYKINYSNLAEIEHGKIANTNGYGSIIKQFGQLMIKDHQTSQNELKTIASKRNIVLPTIMEEKDQSTKSSLTALSGFTFDTTYIKHQINAHTATREMYLTFLDTSKDVELLTYVGKYLPVVIKHLAKADSIANALNTSK